MYSGFITSNIVVPGVGVHQRLDTAAYRMAEPFFTPGSFPDRKQILKFEGVDGPDGIKAKSPGYNDPDHLYNPETGMGDLPMQITTHYNALVKTLEERDLIRAAFEASWLAHYVCDGLTPAHHFPLSEKLAEHEFTPRKKTHFKHPVIARGEDEKRSDAIKRGWALWGGKGLLSTHFNFEIGVATVLVGYRIHSKLDSKRLSQARALGPMEFFKAEAEGIADLKLYESFYEHGWTVDLARTIKYDLAPRAAQAIAIFWLLAYLEAGFNAAISAQEAHE